MPSKKKKYNARFPPGRIKKIMQTDEDVGKVAQAVPVIISRALELFVESLLTKTMEVTSARNAKTLSPSHMKQCIFSESRFDFLKDLVKALPDVAGESDESYSSAVTARVPIMGNGSIIFLGRDDEQGMDNILPDDKEHSDEFLQVGDCGKTYGSISKPDEVNQFENDSETPHHMPVNNDLKSVITGDDLHEYKVTNNFSVAEREGVYNVPLNSLTESVLQVPNETISSDVVPEEQTSTSFDNFFQLNTRLALDEDYDI